VRQASTGARAPIPADRRPGRCSGDEPHRGLVGKPSTQAKADLLRAPPLRQQLAYQLALFTVGFNAVSMMTGAACGCSPVRLDGR
jgi:hypothetical protein